MTDRHPSDRARPAPQHERPRVFEGTFRATVRIFAGPAGPAVSTGTMVQQMALCGRVLTQRYEADPIEGDVDATGHVWTMTASLVGPDGAPLERRAVTTIVDDDHYRMEAFVVRAGSERRVMQIDYVREFTHG